MSSSPVNNFSGTVYIASDHAGYKLKEAVQDALGEAGYKIHDLGPHEFNPDDDYPDYIFPVAEAIHKDPHARAIIFGMSGQGEAMAANRMKGVRAAVYYGGPTTLIKLAREHNDANVLSLSAEELTDAEALHAAKMFLGASFSGATRHARRIKKLDE